MIHITHKPRYDITFYFIYILVNFFLYLHIYLYAVPISGFQFTDFQMIGIFIKIKNFNVKGFFRKNVIRSLLAPDYPSCRKLEKNNDSIFLKTQKPHFEPEPLMIQFWAHLPPKKVLISSPYSTIYDTTIIFEEKLFGPFWPF